jgi:hypothetical protein
VRSVSRERPHRENVVDGIVRGRTR